MTNFVLDTNIITFILREDSKVTDRFQQILLNINDDVIACPVVFYEVRRGLLARDARNQLQHFERLFNNFKWIDYQPDDWRTAADLWAKRRALGSPISDADLLIAVFALKHDAVLVTNNTRHFDQLDLTLEDWSV